MVAAVWRQLRTAARLPLRTSPVGVVLEAPGHGRQRARKGASTVVVTGPPVELLLWVFGRRAVAQVTMAGTEDVVARLRAWAG